MTKLFISYRRKDSVDVCGRISDRLELEFGKDNLFKDVDSLLPGVDFHTQLSEAVGGCDICLVIIGPTWIDALDSEGNRRLLRDDDYVRIEIRTALLRGIPVIPLRVNGAALPCSEQLPADIAPLVGKHSVEVQRDPDFHRSMDRIIADIHRLERSIQTKSQKNVPDVAIKQSDEIALLEELWIKAASPRSGESRFLEGHTVGIDLGTTYSAIARLSPTGDAVILPNTNGRRSTPSVVLLDVDGYIEIGPSFERCALESRDHIVEAVKRQMGNRSFFVVYQNTKLTAEFISALILKKLKQDAESTIGPIANAVITVPYYFNDVRRKATQDAGRIAGLNVVDVINEPTAATLAYAWMRGELGRVDLNQVARTILVYDLGGGTFDVTVVRYTPTQFRVLATDGDVMLGGIDWTRRITDHIAEQFVHRFGADPRDDPDAIRSITIDCEQAKRELSTRSQVPLTIYFKGKTLSLNFSRREFERITADLMQRTRDTTELVLQQAGINPEDLSAVVMVGGSTYMPAVAQMLTEVCGRAPSLELNPEEAVAQGAAIYAAILEARETRVLDRLDEMVTRRLRSVTTNDVNSHSLGVKLTHSGERPKKFNYVMIPKNSPIPASTTQRFVTNAANQTSIHVCILEGESVDPDGCVLIGDFRIDGLPPGLPARSPVEVTYRYDSNGRIHATAKELTNNRVATSEIVRDTGLTPNAVFDLEKLAREFIVE